MRRRTDEALEHDGPETVQIRSPIDGRTGNLTVKTGNVVKSPDDILLTITQVRPIYVAFSVPEQYLPPIRRESREAALAESGDVILSNAAIYAEIGELFAGTKPCPVAETTVYKSVGIAVEDVATAKLVFDAVVGRRGAAA